ncbi:hypothetical protein ACHQM5_020837 [Ranunculus cassubicifolius]
MKLFQVALRSTSGDLHHQWRYLSCIRHISTTPASGNSTENKSNNNSYESEQDFGQRIFGGYSGNNPENDSFYEKLDKLQKDRSRRGGQLNNGGDGFSSDLDESFSTLSDGMDGKLKNAAKSYFEHDFEEIENDEFYTFRPDMKAQMGDTYDTKDLNLREPAVHKPSIPYQFEVTTEQVLRKADFRNVKFLSNFLTDAGIIIKRSSTKISAKAQRKVAREIKTARAFGLMPFTTMGQDRFRYGKSREADISEEEEDYDAGDYYVPDDGFVDPVEEPVVQ